MRNRTFRSFLFLLACLVLVTGVLTSCALGTGKTCVATFVVDGTSYRVDTAHGEIPVYPGGTPTKEPTEATEFVFVRWSPPLGKITEDTTYTPVFEERPRTFDVSVIVTPEGGGTVTGAGKTTYGNDATLTQKETKGYRFLGWYENGISLDNTDDTQIKLCNIASNRAIEARYEPISLTVEYRLPEGATHENPTTYDVTMGEVTLAPARLDGYFFGGFTTEADGGGERIEMLTYDIVAAHPVLYASFVKTAKATFIVTGDTLLRMEKTFTHPVAWTPPENLGEGCGMSAYRVRGWYVDADCREEADLSLPVTNGATYYGVWEYVGTTGFAPYFDKFTAARESGTLTISSEDELLRFSEFVRFYNIDRQIELLFDGSYRPAFSSEKALSSYLQALLAKGEFPNSFGLSYTFTREAPYTLKSLFSSGDIAEEGTRVADPTGEGLYTQYEHIGRISSSGRAADFDAFPIENISATLRVETSSQLVYALEHGYRPIPVADSAAERVYLAAKEVLRRIVDDEMNDFDKLRAIYEWLILTVRYDHTAASEIGSDWRCYDSWYPEGVFFRHTAVCDGIAKSLLILARIENIACVRVSGQVKGGSGHAWNKVYYRGAWYGIDATHGNFSGDGGEYLTYTSFLFSDAYKAKTCDFTIDPKTATPEQGIGFDIYASTVYGTGAQACDLRINDMQELARLAAIVRAYTSEAARYDGVTSHDFATVEIMIDESSGITVGAVCSAFGVYRYFAEEGEGEIIAYVFLLPIG